MGGALFEKYAKPLRVGGAADAGERGRPPPATAASAAAPTTTLRFQFLVFLMFLMFLMEPFLMSIPFLSRRTGSSAREVRTSPNRTPLGSEFGDRSAHRGDADRACQEETLLCPRNTRVTPGRAQRTLRPLRRARRVGGLRHVRRPRLTL